jgi:CMP/dCMP kinase
VSAVSAVPEVRERLLAEQRAVIGAGGIVVEGRDIGTVVAPDAAVKVYLTADADARAARRSAELAGSDVRATHRDLIRRDRLDSGRVTAPLTMAADAQHIDTTPYTLDEVVDQVVALVQRVRESAGP